MKRMIALVAGGVAAAGVASADTEQYQGSFGPQSTNWLAAFDVPQFDTQNGTRTLDCVEIFLKGTVSGSASAESLDNEPATVTLALQATISLSLGMTQLAVVIPVANAMFNASAFDGSIDFGGTSGATFSNLNQMDQTSVTLTAPADLAPWIGGGSVALAGEAQGQSFATGAGNLVTIFMTDGAMEYTVTYSFTVVPTPGAAALAGIAGLVALRRRR